MIWIGVSTVVALVVVLWCDDQSDEIMRQIDERYPGG